MKQILLILALYGAGSPSMAQTPVVPGNPANNTPTPPPAPVVPYNHTLSPTNPVLPGQQRQARPMPGTLTYTASPGPAIPGHPVNTLSPTGQRLPGSVPAPANSASVSPISPRK